MLTRKTFVVFALSLLLVPALAAAAKKNPEATQALLAALGEAEGDDVLKALADGADPLVKDEDENTTLMMAAVGHFFGDEEEAVFKALVKAKVPVEAKNKAGQTALMLAAREGRDDNVTALLALGAQVEAKDPDGWTPLLFAAYNGQTNVVSTLIGAKADLKAKDAEGWDALMLALSEGRGGAAGKLVEAGAAVPAGIVGKQAPLVHAVYGGDLACVRLVLATKPDLGARDVDGWSALELAAYNGYPQIAMELLRAGIDPDLKDKEGKTALDRAKENENAEIVALLGGPWEKPKMAGTKLAVPCPALGGDVQVAFQVDEANLVVTTLYPKPLSYYLGGGNTNRAESAVKYTYEGTAAPAYHFDVDANPRTGRKADLLDKEVAGSEYSLDYMELGTSVTLSYKGPNDEERSKPVFANVLSADLSKMGEPLSLEELGEYSPEAANEKGALQTTVPLHLIGLQKGKKVRVIAMVGQCGPKEVTVKM